MHTLHKVGIFLVEQVTDVVHLRAAPNVRGETVKLLF